MIHISKDGNLWCDCGDAESQVSRFPDEIFPIDAYGRPVDPDLLRGNEKIYQCNHCKAIANIDQVPAAEERPSAMRIRRPTDRTD